MVNTQIRQLRDSIIAMINANPLPIEIKRLVFAEIQTQINSEAERVIFIEKSETKNNEEESEEK